MGPRRHGGLRTQRPPAPRSLIVLMVLTAISPSYLPRSAGASALLFSTGFEGGGSTSLAGWTVSRGLTPEETLVHAGTWAVEGSSSAGQTFAYKKMTPQNDLYFRTWFEVGSRSGSLALLRYNTGTATLLTLGLNKNGGLYTRNTLTGMTRQGGMKPTNGAWHQLELHAFVSGTSSQVEVWLDGVQVPTLSTTDSLGTIGIAKIVLGQTADTGAYDVFFDDVGAHTSFIDTQPPSTPTGLTATPSSMSEVDLAWNPSSDDNAVASYTVYRFDGTSYVQIGTASATRYKDQTVSPSTTYSYEVQALDVVGNRSPPSDPVSATTPVYDAQAPSKPTGLTATPTAWDEIDLSWGASTDDRGVTGYTIYRSTAGGPYAPIDTSTTLSYVDTSVSASTTYSYEVDAFDAAGNHSPPSDPQSAATLDTPIRHVVIIDQENHSFDNVLGALCAQIASGAITGHQNCDGASTGLTSRGSVVPLSRSPDIVPFVDHSVTGQATAIDHGRMDGFDLIKGCYASDNLGCYSQYDPSQIPNLAAYAERYVISDRTFEFTATPSWAGHMILATPTLDGFLGSNPKASSENPQIGTGWGCDSRKDTPWWNGAAYVLQPSCVPDRQGNGPYRPSPVPYVPTIFDSLDAAGLTWKIFGGEGDSTGSGWGWTICPTFYECLGSSQRSNLVASSQVITDAQAGKLPALSIVTPTGPNSQHNVYSMLQGDNWIGQVVKAIQQGPDWSTTAIFITYDDCGCFYDHVPPPGPGLGIREPMVIVSPYAKLGYTDSHVATFLSLMAYTEHTLGLAPLGAADARAYDYGNAFDYSQTPAVPTMNTVHSRIPRRERAWIAAHAPVREAT